MIVSFHPSCEFIILLEVINWWLIRRLNVILQANLIWMKDRLLSAKSLGQAEVNDIYLTCIFAEISRGLRRGSANPESLWVDRVVWGCYNKHTYTWYSLYVWVHTKTNTCCVHIIQQNGSYDSISLKKHYTCKNFATTAAFGQPSTGGGSWSLGIPRKKDTGLATVYKFERIYTQLIVYTSKNYSIWCVFFLESCQSRMMDTATSPPRGNIKKESAGLQLPS